MIPALWPFSESSHHPQDNSPGPGFFPRVHPDTRVVVELPQEAVSGTRYTSPDAPHMQPGRGRVVQCVTLQAQQGCKHRAWAERPRGCRWPPAEQVAAVGRGSGELLGAQISASRGGAGAEVATNPVSAWTPQQPPITVRPTSCPPRPLFPLARWPPRVFGLMTSARADQAMCGVAGPARGPPGLAACSCPCTQFHLPGVVPESPDKAFWEAGFSFEVGK